MSNFKVGDTVKFATLSRNSAGKFVEDWAFGILKNIDLKNGQLTILSKGFTITKNVVYVRTAKSNEVTWDE